MFYYKVEGAFTPDKFTLETHYADGGVVYVKSERERADLTEIGAAEFEAATTETVTPVFDSAEGEEITKED